MVLYHSHGERNPFKTILTEREFCQILTELRDNYDKRDKHLGSIKKDLELTVPGKDKQLSQAIYEYKVRMIDYFPLRVACEVDVVRLRDYFGLRMSAGRRWGGYLSFKFSGQKREGFNADEIGKEMDVSKKTYLGRIRDSYMAGVKYGIISRDYPLYAYLGFGYGEDGSQRSNGKKGKERVSYYNNYTYGFEGEVGTNWVLFDFLSLSMGKGNNE